MNLFSRRTSKPFCTESQYVANRDLQSSMSPMVLIELGKHGVSESTRLKLEVFFYTDCKEKADRLRDELHALNYEVEACRSGDRKRPFLVNGWSPQIQMDEVTVVQWTRQMCDLGQKHDCEFDGWGTTPKQDE